jgi:hypothetical protein
MDRDASTFDGTVNAGRKGIAYDWRTVLAEHTTIAQPTDAQLAALIDADKAPAR